MTHVSNNGTDRGVWGTTSAIMGTSLTEQEGMMEEAVLVYIRFAVDGITHTIVE